jgi:Arc/MetJ-type ribon-helix-helix transcriptional regulator
MHTIQIRLTRELIEDIDRLVGVGVYPNRSEAVRDAVRALANRSRKIIIEYPDKLPQAESAPKAAFANGSAEMKTEAKIRGFFKANRAPLSLLIIYATLAGSAAPLACAAHALC